MFYDRFGPQCQIRVIPLSSPAISLHAERYLNGRLKTKAAEYRAETFSDSRLFGHSMASIVCHNRPFSCIVYSTITVYIVNCHAAQTYLLSIMAVFSCLSIYVYRRNESQPRAMNQCKDSKDKN